MVCSLLYTRGRAVNYTLLHADRATHLRILCVALGATILLVGVCAFARLSPSAGAGKNDGTAITSAVDRDPGHFSAAIERTPL